VYIVGVCKEGKEDLGFFGRVWAERRGHGPVGWYYRRIEKVKEGLLGQEWSSLPDRTT